MMRKLFCFALALLLLCALLQSSSAFGGSWIQLNQQPSGGAGTMLLLSDGTVMAHVGNDNTTASWNLLTPDKTGGYTNGQWTSLPDMHYTRLFFASDVLTDGRVFVAGGEYGTGTTNAEIYDPGTQHWEDVVIPPETINIQNTIDKAGGNTEGFIDAESIVLNNGNVLILPVGVYYNGEMDVYDSYNFEWSSNFLVPEAVSGGHVGNFNEDEATALKLPDDSIMLVNAQAGKELTAAERYIPSLNEWILEKKVCPVQLYDNPGQEQGPAFLLPNGKGFFIGASTHTAIYTPSGNTNDGSWTAGPDMPMSLSAPDAPAAMMNNGRILCVLSAVQTGTNSPFTTPTYFYEYDYSSGSTGSFTQVNSPTGGTSENTQTFRMRMLDLPDGTVLFTDSATCWVYVPGSPQLSSGAPSVTSVKPNPDGTFALTGTGLNGLTQGADYGDDAQMDSNYPIIRLTDSSGNVTYAFSDYWSSTSVQTGSRVITTQFQIPSSIGGTYSLQVVASGLASAPFTFSADWVDFNYFSQLQFGTEELPFSTLEAGVDYSGNGGTVLINAGTQPSTSTETFTISKPVTILSLGGPSTIGVP